MPLDELAAAPGGLDDFRIRSPREMALILKQLCDGAVTLNFNGSNGATLRAQLWAVDTARNRLSFNADAASEAVQTLVECDEATIVAYQDSIKLQFVVHSLVLVRGAAGSALSCSFPAEIYRFQRRNAYRVRPLVRTSPVARTRHPEIAEMQLELRVLDVSIGGCALFMPDDVPPLRPGSLLNHVQMEFDADTRFSANLRLLHVTAIHPESKGARMGCEFHEPSRDLERTLQRFIDQTQKRRRMMALG